MNNNELKATARNLTVEALHDVLEANDAVQFNDASFAILQNIDGQEIWTEVTVKSKAFAPTKVSPAFDPYVAAEDWRLKTEMQAKKKAEVAAKKEAKLTQELAKKAAQE